MHRNIRYMFIYMHMSNVLIVQIKKLKKKKKKDVIGSCKWYVNGNGVPVGYYPTYTGAHLIRLWKHGVLLHLKFTANSIQLSICVLREF